MRQGPTGPPHSHSLPSHQNVGLDDYPNRTLAYGPAAAGTAAERASSSQGHSAPERLPTEDTGYPNPVKISQGSKVAPVAGKIAHSMRVAEWPTLLVAGNGSIHAAVKCCITAGRFLQQDGLLVEFDPTFREADHSRALLALRVLPSQPGSAPTLLPQQHGGTGQEGEIKVSAHSRHAKVGAALCARLVEARSPRVVLLALGETAVANAVMAAAHAAHYLSAQHAGARLAVLVQTAVVVKGGDALTGVQLWVRLQRPGEFPGLQVATAAAAGFASGAGPSGSSPPS